VLKFRIQGGSSFASINKEDPGSGRSIFSRTLLPFIFLALIDCSVILLLRPIEEGEGYDGDDGDSGRFASAFARYFGLCDL